MGEGRWEGDLGEVDFGGTVVGTYCMREEKRKIILPPNFKFIIFSI